MKFTIGGQEGEIEIADVSDFDGSAAALLAHPGLVSAVTEFASTAGFRAWEADEGLDAGTVEKIAGICVTKGTDAAVEYMLDNGLARSPDEYWPALGRDGQERLFDVVGSAVAEYARIATPEAARGFTEALHSGLLELAEEKMAELDRSRPHDIFMRGDTVQLAYIPALGQNGVAGPVQTSYADHMSSSVSVSPDAALMRLFRLLNVSPVEFLQHIRITRGEDLMAPEFNDDASSSHRARYEELAAKWRFVSAVFSGDAVDATKTGIYVLDDPRARAEFAEAVRATRDLRREPAVTMAQLEDVLDNATDGGAPAYIFAANAREVIDGSYEGSFISSGGKVGLLDFLNGSGYFVDLGEDTLIDMAAGKLIVNGTFGHGWKNVFDFTHRELEAETKGARPDRFVEFSEKTYRSIAPRTDGGYIVVHAGATTQSEAVVRSYTGDGAEGGPFAGGQTFDGLMEAATAANFALDGEAAWAAGAAPAAVV